MIKFACTNCGHKMAALEKYAGKRVRCQKCKQPTLIPQISQTTDTKKEEQKNIVKFRCPNCNQKIGVKAEYAGRKVRCAKCRTPIRIPSPTAPKVPPIEKEPAAVLKAGSEQPSEESWGDFGSDFDDLLAAEASAPSIELEKPLKLAPTEETLGSDLSVDQTQYIQTQAIQSPKKKNTRLIFALGALVVAVIIGMVSFFVLPKFEKEKQAQQIVLLQAQILAEDYIDLLKNKEIEQAIQLLSPELQSSIHKNKMDGFATRVTKGPILQITPSIPYVEEIENKKLFYFQYTLFYSEADSQNFEINWENFKIDPMTGEIDSLTSGFKFLSLGTDWQSLIMVISKKNLDLQIEELALYNSATGNTTSVGPRTYEKLFSVFVGAAEQKLRSFAAFLAAYACILIAVLPIFYIIMVVSLWFIFDKSGESRWAAFIPVYNLCVLGKVANRPIWYGLILILASFIPFAGRYVWFFFWADISFGVSMEFDRGVLFTIGMIFFPFIFFPILAFTD